METTARREPARGHGSLGGMIVGNPVVQTLGVMTAVSLATWTGVQAGNLDPFTLQAPVHEPWWQVLVSIYAHAGPSHLLSNATIILVAGGLVSLATTRLRFHLFFITTGALAGMVQVWATDALGDPVAVLGASGAGFALAGYVLTANPASTPVLHRVPWWASAGLATALALALTVALSGANSAYLAHFTGALLGGLAGRFHVLRP